MKPTAIIRLLGLLLAAALLLTACTPKPTPAVTLAAPTTAAPTDAPAVAETPNEVALPLVSGPLTRQTLTSTDIALDPAITTDADSLMICDYIYDGLVGLDAAGNPVPALALDWLVSDDPLDYVFYLRPDVTFHSGTVLNADLVLNNFNRWFDPENPLHGDATYATWEAQLKGFKGETLTDKLPKSTFDGIEKVNELTVLIHLTRPEPNFLKILADPAFSLTDTEILAVEGTLYGTAAGSTVGTGPYRLAAWTDAALALEPNPNYWGEVPAEALQFDLP